MDRSVRTRARGNASPPDPFDALVEELEQNLAIDEHDLDTACIQQPDDFYRAAKSLAMYLSRRDEAKQLISEAEARVDTQYRHQAEVNGDKVREAEVANAVTLDREVQEEKRKLLEINERVGIITALKEAYAARGYVLKDLAALWIAGYYQQSSAGNSSADVRTINAERARRAREQGRVTTHG